MEQETKFNRDKLQVAIPARLRELMDVLASQKGKAESWYVDLVTKILQSVDRVRNDLLKTMDQEAVSAAAWNARNLLELWTWIKYCAVSQANARRFHEDSLRDMQGLVDSLLKLHKLRGIPNEFENSAKQKIAEVSREKLGTNSLDGSYKRVSEAASSIGIGDWFLSNNSFLSKFAHPTAGLVLGIMHQKERLCHFAGLIDNKWSLFCRPVCNRFGGNHIRYAQLAPQFVSLWPPAYLGSITFRPLTFAKWRLLKVAKLLSRSSAVAATMRS